MSENKKIYKALGRNVFVKEIATDMTVDNTWIIPDSVDNDFTFGEVLSVAEGYFERGNFIPAAVATGDKVVFPKVAGTKVTLNGEKLIRVFMDDIIAKEIDGEVLPE